MTLPMLEGSVVPAQLYPDRIRVNYRYAFTVAPAFDALCDALREVHFHRIDANLRFRGRHVPSNGLAPIDAYISISRDRRFLNFYVDINPLRHLHEADPEIPERSLDGEDNWLADAQIGSENRFVAHHANDLIWQGEASANDLAGDVARLIGGASVATYQGVSVDRMDVTCDLALPNPLVAFGRIRAAFRSAFSDLRENPLSHRGEASEEIRGNIPILHGSWRSGATFRLYPKTNRRVRLECEVRAAGFQGWRLRRSLDRHDCEFGNLFAEVAQRATPQFNRILGGQESPTQEVGSILEFVMGIAAAVHEPQFATMLVQVLATTDHVTTQLDGVRVRMLARRGYLERVARGVYREGARWRSAVRQLSGLRTHPGFLLVLGLL